MALKLDNISLQDIFDYVENGKQGNADPEILRYLNLMDKIHTMHHRINKYGSKEMILKHLVKVEGLSQFLANQMYEDAIDYFFSDTHISKQAQRNIIADKIAKAANMAIIVAKTPQDWKYVTQILVDEWRVRMLDKEDAQELPEGIFQKPFKMYMQSAEALGMPPINRIELAKFIDEFPEITEKEKEALRREASIIPNKLFLDEQEDPRK